MTQQFSVAEADLLRRRRGEASIVVPGIQAPATIRAGNRTRRTTIAGATEAGPEVFTSDFTSGRHYNRSEYVTAARVVFLGSRVRDELFPNQDPVGKEVSINGQRFRVIGSIAAQGGSLTGDQDNQIYMPTTTAQRLLATDDLSSIIMKANEAEDVEQLKARVEQLLKPSFGSEFTVFTQDETLGLLTQILGTLTFMLAGIAAISLLVGGIGIMNIMLVSVSERTREIGIRKAVGARTYDILSQFVIEAVVLSVIGGVLGIALGWAGSLGLDRWVPTEVTWWAVALAFFFSAAVGIFFGVYPAWKASRLDPIEALRYE